MKDNEQTEIKKGFDIPYPEFDAPSVTIGGDAVKLPETIKTTGTVHTMMIRNK